jgi:hypothetical protein
MSPRERRRGKPPPGNRKRGPGKAPHPDSSNGNSKYSNARGYGGAHRLRQDPVLLVTLQRPPFRRRVGR